MSAGISGSYTVLSAATISAVSCSSSSGGMEELGSGAAGADRSVIFSSMVAFVGWVERSDDPTQVGALSLQCWVCAPLDPTYAKGHMVSDPEGLTPPTRRTRAP